VDVRVDTVDVLGRLLRGRGLRHSEVGRLTT
jgi:hypothetical protein